MQGTPPFIALELLIHGSLHRVAHDLESVLYVLLFVCTHLNGPYGEKRDPPLYGGIRNDSKTHPSCMKAWLNPQNKDSLQDLGYMKYGHMMGYFESEILKHISPYFHPLKHHIKAFWNTLIPPETRVLAASGNDEKRAIHSLATPGNIINVFKVALLDDRLIEDAKAARKDHNKRSHPGDLVADSNCWDTVKLPSASKKPKLAVTNTRNAKLATRGTRNIASKGSKTTGNS